jgi:hypothetical protein
MGEEVTAQHQESRLADAAGDEYEVICNWPLEAIAQRSPKADCVTWS